MSNTIQAVVILTERECRVLTVDAMNLIATCVCNGTLTPDILDSNLKRAAEIAQAFRPLYEARLEKEQRDQEGQKSQ